jgi:hypothetical protein
MAKRRRSPAVIFLWIIAILTMLFIAGAILFAALQERLYRWALVPSAAFVEAPMPEGRTYRDASMWIARPDIADSPSSWLPQGVAPSPAPARAATFFIHPTSFLERNAWNAPLDHEESQWRAGLFVRSQASAFNHLGPVWAPKYRQATFGAFLTDQDNARRALDLAYGDVLAAFEQFLREAPADAPIVLAGHSQGSLHLLRLLQERLRGRPEAQRIAAAYVVGWPISLTADVPALPIPLCRRAGEPGCIASWMSFAEPADPDLILELWNATTGPTGVRREGTDILCVNPLSGNAGDAAPAAANRGTLIPNGDLSDASLRAQAVPARCGERGFLLIGDDPPEMGNYVLPGNNYHVYDYALFWANVRADAAARVAAFAAR